MNRSVLSKPSDLIVGFGDSFLIRLVAGFRIGIGLETLPIDGLIGWIAWSDPVFKTVDLIHDSIQF